MRPSLRLFATPATSRLKPGSSQRPPPLNLLPAIPLYRRLLRLHRKKLDPEERVFGDTYLKAEFHRHKGIDNPLHIVGFLTQWQIYGQMIADKDAKDKEGVNTGPGQSNEVHGEGWKKGAEEWRMEYLLDKMSDQQVGQVYELFEAISKRGRESVDEEDLVRRAEMAREEDGGGGKS